MSHLPKELRLTRPKLPRLESSHPNYDAVWVERVKSLCVVTESGCWLWQHTRTPTGYGTFMYRGKANGVHRNMYAVLRGVKLQKFDYVCHTCDRPNCCNPDHMYIGSPKTNMEDKVRRGRHHEMKVTHCPKGHPYDAENTYIPPGRNNRHCKACSRIRCREAWKNGKAKARQQRLRERKRQSAQVSV